MIKIEKDKLHHYSEIEFPDGIIILIGRNGVGKTTLLRKVEEYCKEKDIPVFSYDNYKEGSTSAMDKYLHKDMLGALASVAFHSEGEQLFFNFGEAIQEIGQFIRKNKEKEEKYILLDALDSGLDIDGIDQVLQILNIIAKENKGTKILVTANNYAIIDKQLCLDVRKGIRIKFEDFDSYALYIRNQYKEDRAKAKKRGKGEIK